MHKCVCKKAYRHASSLSRHRRGSTSRGILPCPIYLSKERSTPPPVEVFDHDPMSVPDFMHDLLSKDVMREGRIVGFTRKWFEALHMDASRPEYWNVILYNSKTMRLRVRKEGTWKDSSFNEWADTYGPAVAVMYIDHVFPVTAQYADVLRIVDESKREIREGLKSALLQPDFRRAAKLRFGMR